MTRTVLIVDDDPFIRRLVTTTLQDVQGFELVEAVDGQDAVEVAGERPPAIVILDVDMPRLDGIAACARLRAGAGARATIVMLTAAGGKDVERRAREAGADLFLTKPFSPLDLLRLVDDLG
jgi:two-component system chemotaxis response regulator CheY